MINQGNMQEPPARSATKLMPKGQPSVGAPASPEETPEDFAVSGSPYKCNSRGGVDHSGGEAADAALAEFRGVSKSERISSMPHDGRSADIPSEGYKSPANLEFK